MHEKHESIEIYKKTSDDWFGNFKIVGDCRVSDLVSVMFVTLPPYKNSGDKWRVHVWGNDDCGMEYDTVSREEAWELFQTVIAMDDVTKKSLEALGFVRC